METKIYEIEVNKIRNGEKILVEFECYSDVEISIIEAKKLSLKRFDDFKLKYKGVEGVKITLLEKTLKNIGTPNTSIHIKTIKYYEEFVY